MSLSSANLSSTQNVTQVAQGPLIGFAPVTTEEPGARLKVGILGAGRWGSHLIRNFGAAARAEVVAVADPYAPALERVGSLLEEAPLLTTDWREMMATPGLEAVVVATPAVTHYEVIEAALKQGLHVLAEKPLTLTPAECETLCWLADASDRQLMVDHTYLFHPAVAAGYRLIQDGVLGQLRYGYASRTHLGPVRQDVDALWDLAIHDIAIFNYWLGLGPTLVQAQGQICLQPHLQTPLSPQGLADTVWAQLLYPFPSLQAGTAGLSVNLHFSWLNPDKQRKLVLVGDRGALIFDELAEEPLVLMRGRLEPEGQRIVPVDQVREAIMVPHQEPLKQMCEHFIDCAQLNQVSPISPGIVGRDLVTVLSGLSQSLNEDGQPVLLG